MLPLFVAEALWPDFHRLTEFRPVLCVGFGGYDKAQLQQILRRDARGIVSAAAAQPQRSGSSSLGGRAAAAAASASAPGGSGDGGGGDGGGMAAFEAFLPLFVDFFSEVCRDLRELRFLCGEVFRSWMLPVRREGHLHLRTYLPTHTPAPHSWHP